VTAQDVDPETYYAVGKGLFEKAGKLYDAFNVNVGILAGTESMAGTDDAGTAWAASYDERASEVLGAANDLMRAMENYGGVVIQAGYNHAVAEHNATPGKGGPAPTKPPEPASAAGVLTAPPSAGGPGRGLVDAIGLMQQVGVPVPDGDTEKVSTAAEAWDRLATVYQTTTVAEGLEVDARAFRDTKSPEVEYIVKDLEELRDATSLVLNGCAELAQSCREYRSALDDLRTQLEGILNDLAVELAVTAAVGIAASFVSFGVGAVAGTAKAAQSITKYARIIASAVGAWKLSKNIGKGVKRVHDIAGLRAKLQRIKNIGRKNKPAEKPPATPPPPPPGVPPGWVARPADNGMGTVYQQPGAVGNSNSIRIMEPGADPRYPNGYVRYTNEHNQPINLDGKPGSRADTHIPRNPDGSYPIPRGWP
jgi:hypothetical protein